jgi:myo-inositol-1(or 4)-monophosphatase
MDAGHTYSLKDDLDLLLASAKEAGALAMRFFRKPVTQWLKEGASPVSEADMAVDQFLKKTLLAARPEYGWLSEETADTPERHTKRTVFIVDPIDGTRGFLAGVGEWTISLAIVTDKRPQIGVIYNPVTDEMFQATMDTASLCNDKALNVSQIDALNEAHICMPQSLRGGLSVRPKHISRSPASLAYRLAKVSGGQLDATAVRPRSCDWDLAAADLIVHQAGGHLTTLEGDKPLYNTQNLRHNVLVCGPPCLVHILREDLKTHFSQPHTL